MDKRKISNISSRHKRRLAQEETEKDYLLLNIESSSNDATYFQPSTKSIKECRIVNENNQSSVSVSPSFSNMCDQKYINQYLPNFSGNNEQEILSDEVYNSSDVVTDNEDSDNTEEAEMQALLFNFNDSSDDADMDVEYIDDKNIDNELLRKLRNWSLPTQKWILVSYYRLYRIRKNFLVVNRESHGF